jgi:hypothetical protein
MRSSFIIYATAFKLLILLSALSKEMVAADIAQVGECAEPGASPCALQLPQLELDAEEPDGDAVDGDAVEISSIPTCMNEEINPCNIRLPDSDDEGSCLGEDTVATPSGDSSPDIPSPEEDSVSSNVALKSDGSGSLKVCDRVSLSMAFKLLILLSALSKEMVAADIAQVGECAEPGASPRALQIPHLELDAKEPDCDRVDGDAVEISAIPTCRNEEINPCNIHLPDSDDEGNCVGRKPKVFN